MLLYARIFTICFAAANLVAQPTPGSVVSHKLPLGGAPSVIDPAGNVYAIGGNNSGLGVTPGAAQTKPGGGGCFIPMSIVPCYDVFIVKANAAGNTVFASLLGGPTNDSGSALTVDQGGNVYVVGTTGGSFPTTAGAAVTASNTSITFAAKLSADGSQFLYSTYLPDTIANLSAVAVDSQGNAYVAGQTKTKHACLIKLSSDGSAFIYTKILAGANAESATSLVLDANGNPVVAGYTTSPDFPVSTGVVQSQLDGAQNAFLTKLDADGNIVFSTFLGGSGKDAATAVAIAGDGSLFVTGPTTSLDFPTTSGTFQPAPLVPAWSNSPGGFVAKLSSDATSLEYGTYLWSDVSPILALAPSGDLFVAGGSGLGFPVTPSAPIQCPSNAGGETVVHLDVQGALVDATYVNDVAAQAIAIGSDGSVSLAGEQFWTIRFGAQGWTALPCMTLSILNSATLGPAEVVPGEFASLIGFGIGPDQAVSAQPDAQGTPTTLGGVQVLFDGVPAPVVYAQSRQVNFQAPFELIGQSKTNITLQYGSFTFGPFGVSIRFADPGLFRLQPNVSALAYAVNQDQTINSPLNPAARGSMVSLWGTGFGSTSPGCPTGGLNAPGPVDLAPGLSVVMTGGGTVQYAGGAPTLACGIFQINMQVPLGAQPGALTINPEAVLTDPDGTSHSVDPSTNGAIIYVK
jgi:uncharacterized protein (TIGR03437 family)